MTHLIENCDIFCIVYSICKDSWIFSADTWSRQITEEKNSVNFNVMLRILTNKAKLGQNKEWLTDWLVNIKMLQIKKQEVSCFDSRILLQRLHTKSLLVQKVCLTIKRCWPLQIRDSHPFRSFPPLLLWTMSLKQVYIF